MIERLEQVMKDIGYEDLRTQIKRIDDLSLDELRALMAYELLEDGMEPVDAEDVWRGRNNLYETEEQIKDELVNTFGY